ncbi:hypothetical protein [Nocardioides daphniae]|uniref:Galactose oxidase n=1 Tax=Nocardioides daphniae TaxID=402297 RepID=A0A4P7UAJ2_9ACTN|nr:hypothetical protein [Nocardioides daphniae]QCC77103.1 hypothetical protein E2C04_07560 [Nocardioides daphniae]
MRLLHAVGLALILLVGGACSGEPAGGPATDVRPPSEATVGRWSRLPDLPLSPRRGPVVAAVGGRVVVVGGYTGFPCPPHADCVYDDDFARDGVTLHDGGWQPIADLPVQIPERASSAVLPSGLFVLAEGEILHWRSDEDAWSRIPLPRGQQHGALVAHDGRLHLVQGSDELGERPDYVLTQAGAWEPLPDDPYDASFDRAMVSTPHGLVLTRRSIAAVDRGTGATFVEAAVLRADRWRELGRSDQLGGGRWAWAGERAVDATLGGADGGQVNGFGRVIPYGGRLDPATGRWSRLPPRPGSAPGGGRWRRTRALSSRRPATCTTTPAARGPGCRRRRGRRRRRARPPGSTTRWSWWVARTGVG